jgi:hypothetical protein
MDGSQAYTLRKKARTLIWDSYVIGHNTAGNVRPLVVNHVTEFNILTFGPTRK